MRGNPHVRFGGRAEETDPPKGGHRASVRSNHTHASLLIVAGVPISATVRSADRRPWPVDVPGDAPTGTTKAQVWAFFSGGGRI